MNDKHDDFTTSDAREFWDTIVIGGSVAGLSAALMLGRARRRVLVIDAGAPRNRFAANMHGVLGHEGVPPATLTRRARDEVTGYGVEFCTDEVSRVTEVADGLEITTADGRTERCRSLVVATGITDELPPIPGLAEQWGTGVLHCPYCHGWEVRDRRLGILATSPMALHQARMVRQWSDRVTLFSSALGPLDPADEARLRSRGVEIVSAAVTEIVSEGGAVTGARTDDGQVVALDAVFTAGEPRPHDTFLAELELPRTTAPMLEGSFLEVDAAGHTGHERIWAAGNVVAPMANVPLAMGAGCMAGAAVNGWLVEDDFDRAAAAVAPAAEPESLEDHWNARYGEADRLWSGRVNHVLAGVADGLTAGTALDLGCGEGGDAIWLAQRGWRVTGVDVSSTALERGRAAARDLGVPDEMLHFETGDLSIWQTPARHDLVTASFLHSLVEIPREQILQRATGFVAPGGRLLIVSHAAPPPWTAGEDDHDHDHEHTHRFPSPEEDLAALALDPAEWSVLICEQRERSVIAPDGTPASLVDGVVLVQRRPAA